MPQKDSRALSFVVLGDTHYCTEAIRGKFERKCTLAELPDSVRYSGMVKTVLEPMFEKIRSLNPDFVISTGDFVEGGMPDSEDRTYIEMQEGWNLMKSLGVPCLIAKGTHEGSGSSAGAKAYRDIVLPGMSVMTGKIIDKEYFRFDYGGCAFFLLDYLDYRVGSEQDKWLENGLGTASDSDKTIFIVAHPPLYNWGRHFFSEPDFTNRIIEFCRRYPLTAYLCGHTHNQTVSYHKTDIHGGFVQIMGSSVGYEHMDLVPLNQFHNIAEFSAHDHFLWGLCEDSSPGYHLIEIIGGYMTVEWYSFKGDNARVELESIRGAPIKVIPPSYRPVRNILTDEDALIVKSAVLHVFGTYYAHQNSRVYLNDVYIGRLPMNVSYAGRRFIQVCSEAIKTIQRENSVRIKLPDDMDFALGSISLEIVLLDNRTVRSQVMYDVLVCGRKWDRYPDPGRLKAVCPGEEVCFDLNFVRSDS